MGGGSSGGVRVFVLLVCVVLCFDGPYPLFICQQSKFEYFVSIGSRNTAPVSH